LKHSALEVFSRRCSHPATPHRSCPLSISQGNIYDASCNCTSATGSPGDGCDPVASVPASNTTTVIAERRLCATASPTAAPTVEVCGFLCSSHVAHMGHHHHARSNTSCVLFVVARGRLGRCPRRVVMIGTLHCMSVSLFMQTSSHTHTHTHTHAHTGNPFRHALTTRAVLHCLAIDRRCTVLGRHMMVLS
jgi:hypothetical protein